MKLKKFNNFLIQTENQSQNYVECLYLYYDNYSKFYEFLTYLEEELNIDYTLIPSLKYKEVTEDDFDTLKAIKLDVCKNDIPLIEDQLDKFNLRMEVKDSICHLFL